MMDNYENLFAMLYKKALTPSEDLSTYWHQAVSPKLKSFQSNEKTGKWCIFLSKEEVDSAWDKIKTCVQKGLKKDGLFLAKASTALGVKSSHTHQHVICVYTHDWSDKKELEKTRETLKNLGFTEPLKYKRDVETQDRKYQTEDEFYLEM